MKSRKKSYVILAFIILLQLCYTTYVFACEKQGFHSDEIWSYGLANSYYQPFIYMRDGVFIDSMQGMDLINYNEWITGNTFKDYITVQPEERFSYGSVYHNQTLDHHPPLYYMLLHTICSLFPNSFSFWYGYLLSALCLIGTQFFLYKLVDTVSHCPTLSLLTCAFYGAGTGALSTFLFLRQYNLLTMLGVLFTYCSALCFQKFSNSNTQKQYSLWKLLMCTAVSALLMFLTHYVAIAYVGVFTFCFCIYLLLRKKWQVMFAYGGSVLSSLLLFLLIYPASIMQIQGNGGKVTTLFSVPTQIRMLLDFLGQYNLGFEVYMFGTAFWSILPPFLGLGILFICLLLFPFRHEEWFHKMCVLLRAFPGHFLRFLQRANYIPLITLVSALAIYPVVAKITDVFRMGEYAMRYIFMSFPLICFVVVYALFGILQLLMRAITTYFTGRKSLPVFSIKIPFALQTLLLGFFLLAMVIRVHIIGPCPLLFRHYGNETDVATLLEGKNVLIIEAETKDVWKLTCYCPYIFGADHVFFTTADTIEDHLSEIAALGAPIDYCLVSAGTMELNNAETQLVLSWMPKEDTSAKVGDSTSPGIIIEEDDSLKKEPAECGSIIRELPNGGEYEILSGLNIQGGLVYVLKLQ